MKTAPFSSATISRSPVELHTAGKMLSGSVHFGGIAPPFALVVRKVLCIVGQFYWFAFSQRI